MLNEEEISLHVNRHRQVLIDNIFRWRHLYSGSPAEVEASIQRRLKVIDLLASFHVDDLVMQICNPTFTEADLQSLKDQAMQLGMGGASQPDTCGQGVEEPSIDYNAYSEPPSEDDGKTIVTATDADARSNGVGLPILDIPKGLEIMDNPQEEQDKAWWPKRIWNKLTR
ncbi:MAG: hypothetical protein WAZ14_04160 [Patescibacteria group bacterium]